MRMSECSSLWVDNGLLVRLCLFLRRLHWSIGREGVIPDRRSQSSPVVTIHVQYNRRVSVDRALSEMAVLWV